MPTRIFVTGASGFVGTALLEELAARNYPINALANRRESSLAGVKNIRGSLFNEIALQQGMLGCDAVIHLVGIIMEKPSRGITFERIHVQGTKNVVDAAKRAGIKRYIHMSALGARPSKSASAYHQTKFAAEEYVRESGLEWTIFRPSLIHGPRGEFMQMEAKWARHTAPPFLFMPYFGAGILGQRGAGLLQPIFVKDVARAFVDALENRKSIGEIYPLGGADRFTWPQLHKTIAAQVVGHSRMTLPIPVWAAKIYAAVGIAALLGFNRDQVIMSQEDNICETGKFATDFGWQPQSFESSLRGYAAQL
jgi:NADH dehydrogenase